MKSASSCAQATEPDDACQASSVAASRRSGTTSVARYFELLRKAVSDTGWTCEAIAAELNDALPGRRFDKTYVWRMLNQEKPFPPEVLVALPEDIEARFEQLRAEACGLLVIVRVDHATAQQQLASGLFNLLALQLPARAAAPVKADLAPRQRVAVNS